MPRKPAPLELVGGRGPRQRVWDLIRACGDRPWDLREVTPDAVPDDTARTYVSSLERAGIVGPAPGRTRISGQQAKCRVLLRDAGAEAPRVDRAGRPVTQGLPQEQMWRTLRTLRGDTNARELAAHASTPEIPVREAHAADYLRTLHAADYLVLAAEARRIGARGGRVQARYRLARDTGPRPPMICRTDSLYDPNVGAVVWTRHVTDEDAIYA